MQELCRFEQTNFWANEGTVLEYLENNLITFVDAARTRLGLPSTQKALVLVDVFRAHLAEAVKAKLEKHGILMVTLPACARSAIRAA